MNTAISKAGYSREKNSLSRRFSINLSLVVVGILLLFSIAVILFNYLKIEKELNEQLNDTLQLAETSLPTAVWQMDYSSMDDILGAILVNDAIASVRIIADNTPAASKTQPRYDGREFSYFRHSHQFLVKSVDVKRMGEKVGKFEVAISKVEMKRGVVLTISGILGLVLVLCFAIIFTSVFITKRHIFQPLMRLESHAHLIAAGNLDSNIEIQGNDEFAQLALALNSMANQLKISFDTLEQKVMERTADLYLAKTEAEKMNQHLAVVGAEVQALLDNSPVGILFVDFERVIHRVNPEITRITGYGDEDLIGKTTRVFFPSEELFTSFGERNYMILRMQGFCQANVEVVKKDGSVIMCYWQGRIIVAEGGIEGVVWSLEDISMRLKMEEELLKVKKLESIGVLAGGIAHDFNNLLLAIIGNISLAKRIADQDDQIQELLSSAQKASERAKDLTVKLLTFASGGEPVKETQSLPQLLEESASFVLSGSNVKSVFHFSENLWQVSMDKAQINQVIQNLVLNADQSMPEGGVIEISCENAQINKGEVPGLDDGRYVHVTVKDSGAGISRENINRIFDPYFSTKAKDSNKGSGLGLAIVHSIILKHGGMITVDSTLGSGSEFSIFLPALEEQEQSAIELEKSIAKGKGRILVMDDEEMIRKVVSEMLEHLGYQAVQAADGRQAVSIYREQLERGEGLDAVIMDLTIPGGMGGVEAAREIVAIDAKAKVVVSSGYSRDPILDDYKSYGFCNIVRKPYQLLDLSMVLSETLTS